MHTPPLFIHCKSFKPSLSRLLTQRRNKTLPAAAAAAAARTPRQHDRPEKVLPVIDMFLSKLARTGVQLLIKEPNLGQYSISRTRLLQGSSRWFFQSGTHFFSTSDDKAHEEGINQKDKISVTFVDKDGEEKHIKVPIGMSMLEAAHENDIELEGACEGSLACSTCHVIVMDMEYYNKLEDPTDEENDMLDLAFGLTETSRLGCQVIAKPELDGLRLALPMATRNFAVDGFVPKPH